MTKSNFLIELCKASVKTLVFMSGLMLLCLVDLTTVDRSLSERQLDDIAALMQAAREVPATLEY